MEFWEGSSNRLRRNYWIAFFVTIFLIGGVFVVHHALASKEATQTSSSDASFISQGFKNGTFDSRPSTSPSSISLPAVETKKSGNFVPPSPASVEDYRTFAREWEKTHPPGSASLGSSSDYYINSDGISVQRPAYASAAPAGATAECVDGAYSFSLNHKGTCSGHGGVSLWLDTVVPACSQDILDGYMHEEQVLRDSTSDLIISLENRKSTEVAVANSIGQENIATAISAASAAGINPDTSYSVVQAKKALQDNLDIIDRKYTAQEKVVDGKQDIGVGEIETKIAEYKISCK